MNNVKRYVFSIFFCALILAVQGGFYLLHEHSLEILSHKCIHDGEHDQTYDEDCAVCEIQATVQYDIFSPLSFSAPEFCNTFLSFDICQSLSETYFELNNRGPPSIS